MHLVGARVQPHQQHHIRAVTALGGVVRTEQHDGFYVRRNLECFRITRQVGVFAYFRVFGPEVAEKTALTSARAVEADRPSPGKADDEHEQE